MKTLLTISTLLFTLMFSSTSFADWTKLGAHMSGTTYYVDFDRIRKHDGFVYYWVLGDYLKPQNGNLSAKVYTQGDCKLFRYKILSVFGHKEPMGAGTGESYQVEEKWEYPPPDDFLKSVCSR